ncbi:MAG: hypothetical protein IJR72_01515 [Oscillospiraceae bacterium]|nr:hypothetical protein [Oscillospiraceae bacterium]
MTVLLGADWQVLSNGEPSFRIDPLRYAGIETCQRGGGAGIAWGHGQNLAPHELYELSRAGVSDA